MNSVEQFIGLKTSQGLCCSQIIVLLGLKSRGLENDDLVSAASGLCRGLHSGKICGAVTAACMVLAMFDKKHARRVYDTSAYGVV